MSFTVTSYFSPAADYGILIPNPTTLYVAPRLRSHDANRTTLAIGDGSSRSVPPVRPSLWREPKRRNLRHQLLITLQLGPRFSLQPFDSVPVCWTLQSWYPGAVRRAGTKPSPYLCIAQAITYQEDALSQEAPGIVPMVTLPILLILKNWAQEQFKGPSCQGGMGGTTKSFKGARLATPISSGLLFKIHDEMGNVLAKQITGYPPDDQLLLAQLARAKREPGDICNASPLPSNTRLLVAVIITRCTHMCMHT